MDLLATSGNTIKLWDAATFSLCQEIPFENGRVYGLSWNQDGQCIASLGETGEEIFLSAIKAKSAANIGVVRGIEAPSCLQFASRVPHYLGVGTRSGSIAIWNVKSHTQKKCITVADGVISHICFSHNDSHITAATKKGSFHSLSVVNNATTGPFKIFENQGVTDMMYNRFKKSLVGCCSEVGGVALFDTHSGKVVHAIPKAHNAPAAAIAFSPINEFLMVSVGYDKRFACYNVQTKEPLMTYRCPDPLTSVAFLAGGQRVALGTMTGKVFVHDLRSLRPPLATLSAHTTDVTNIRLQPLSRSKSESGASASRKAAQTSTTATSLQVDQPQHSKSWSDQADREKSEAKKTTDVISNEKAAAGSQQSSPSVFSPIRSTTKGSPVECEARVFGESIDLWDVFSPVRQADNHAVAGPLEMSNIFSLTCPNETQDIPMPPELADIFSPIRQSRSSPKTTASPLTQMMRNHDEDDVVSSVRNEKNATNSFPGQNSTSCHRPKIHNEVDNSSVSLKDKENVEPFPGQADNEMETQSCIQTSNIMSTTPCGKLVERQCGTDIVNPLCDTVNALDMNEIRNKKACSQNVPPDFDNTTYRYTPVNKTKESSEARLVPSSPTDATPRKKQFLRPGQGSDLLSEAPGSVMQTEEIQSDTPGSLIDAGGAGGATQLQIELVRNCVAEVVEDCHDDINRRLLHLQYIMTKYFLEQQVVMERLHRQYSLNEDLLQENERLRQELSRLQSKY